VQLPCLVDLLHALGCCCSYCDVLDKDNMARIILENGITHVIHFATLLSGGAHQASEQQRLQADVAWNVPCQPSAAGLQCVIVGCRLFV
jgi:hypothetical protein